MAAATKPNGSDRRPRARLLYTSDVAREVGVSLATIVRLAEQGKLPFVRFGRGPRRFRPDDVQRFVAELWGGGA